MRSFARTLAVLFMLSLAAPLATVQAVDGVHYGDGYIPAGCSTDSIPSPTVDGPHFLDGCYHMRTNLNPIDTPLIDVLIVPPASPHAERDLRTMRQALEMWSEGIEYLAPQMGLDWLSTVEFNILVDDGTFTTDPAWDPEIVVIGANPVVAGVQGIGIDPTGVFLPEGLGTPCRGANPLASFEAWEALPGFDSHHDGHSGTYVERCEGGGNVCYAVNLAIDPIPGVVEDVLGVNMFDLVAHEVGHCLALGHVGDAGDHTAETVPGADIMAYTSQPHFKCVSSLDVEVFALRMSRFLLAARLVANDASNPDDPFQVQHPRDHFYASSTGLPEDCPQPDTGLTPLQEPRSFTPDGGIQRAPPALDVTSHADGDSVAAGLVTIAGTVRYGASVAGDGDADGLPDTSDNCVAVFNPNQADRDDDGLGDACDATDGAFPVPDGSVAGGITMFSGLNPLLAHNELVTAGTALAGDAKPKFTPGEPVSLQSRFTTAPPGLVDVGTSTFTWHIWDSDGNIVVTAPCTTSEDSSAVGSAGFDCIAETTLPEEPGAYYASALLDGGSAWIRDEPVEDLDHPGLKGFEVLGVDASALEENSDTIVFEDDSDNTFFTEESTLGLDLLGTTRSFQLPLAATSDVIITLEWTSLVGADDLDLFVSGAATDSSAETLTTSERLTLVDVPAGTLVITVDPFFISDPVLGATYTLVAEVSSEGGGPTDADGDGVDDADDLCPATPAGTPVDADGCPLPPPTTERVAISVDGVEVASEDVAGAGGDTFSQAIDLTGRSGAVEVTVAWYDGEWLVREETLTLVVQE
jgi:hypothetical protein